jgi:hypothetical protein
MDGEESGDVRKSEIREERRHPYAVAGFDSQRRPPHSGYDRTLYRD